MLNGEPVQIVKIRDDDHRLVLKTFSIVYFQIKAPRTIGTQPVWSAPYS